MRKTFLKAIVGLLGIIVIGVILVSAAMALGLIDLSVSSLHSYRFNPEEKATLDVALISLHQKMGAQDYESVVDDLVEARIPKEQNIREMKEARTTFGEPVESQFFRSSWPEPASLYYSEVEGSVYTVSYFTKGANAEYAENIDWVIDGQNRARIRAYSARKIVDWQEKTRERERIRAERFGNEIRIPIGDRFIEIHY